jgi:hypothetical protein
MAASVVMFAIIISLGIFIMIQFIQYDQLEKSYFEFKDSYLNIILEKKLIEKKSLLRPEEITFYKLLQKLIPKKYFVVPQVSLSSIADVKIGYRDHDNLYYNLRKSIFDYVIFDDKFNPLVAVELNGSSHFLNNRKNRDAMSENLVKNLGMKFVTINRYNEATENGITTKILSILD